MVNDSVERERTMIQVNQPINSHIETYLDYYCELSHAPGFAVLLKGQWGAGKTYFINKYFEKLKEQNQKILYISLYGLTTFSDIEDAFFQQLHPLLSSKGMAIAGKVLKGFLKGALKIDLNNDGKDDGTLSVQIPEVNLPEYLKDTDKSILVFDDLERCKIDLDSLLGYINYFVEHQELKVVLVANEDELIKNCSSYQVIKEKLIGKTFGVSPDFERALENFIIRTVNSNVRIFLSDNIELIQDLYKKANYENLRNLKQIILDFERIFEALPEKATTRIEILQDLLKLLMAFSIEIKRGAMLPSDISKLQGEYVSGVSRRVNSPQALSSCENKNIGEQSPLQEMLDRYTMLNLHDPFPSAAWWQTFFDKGIVDAQELEQSILNSRYFQDENTSDWVRLWHYSNLSDDDFDSLLKKVESDYSDRKFVDLGVIKHFFGLFLVFSNGELFCKSKQEILEDSKLYIDHLKNSCQLALINPLLIEDISDSYGSLGFQGREFRESEEFYSYISEVRELASVESLPSASQDLLVAMQNDVWKFYRMVCLSSFQNEDTSSQRYYETPILKYIDPVTFIKGLLSVVKSEDKRCVFWALKKRYEFDGINKKLIEELDWLKSVQSLLLDEANCKKGKVSGFFLKSLNTHYLSKIIEKLEATSCQSNQ